MKNVLFFDQMLTPKIITFVYWLLLMGVVLSGLWLMLGAIQDGMFWKLVMGLLLAVGGAIAARIWCELLIVLFKMNEALQELRQK